MSIEQEMAAQQAEKKHLDAVFWGGAFLWAGLVFAADALDFLPQIGDANAWSWIFLGAGVYGLFLGLFRLISDRYTSPTTSDWVWAVIFVIIGAAGFMAVGIPWWLILILIGVAILINAFLRSD